MEKPKKTGTPWYYLVIGIVIFGLIDTLLVRVARIRLGALPTVVLLLAVVYWIPKAIWTAKNKYNE